MADAQRGKLAGKGSGFWAVQVLTEASFLFLAAMGIGLMLNRRWAIRSNQVTAVITLATAAWFILS